MKRLPYVALIVLAACSGGPLKERPKFDAPPEEMAAPQDEAPPPIPAPEPPAPVAEPPKPAPPAEIHGLWSSVAATGAGSAAIRRVHLAFNRDGSVEGAAFVADGDRLRVRTLSGRFEHAGDSLRVDFADGRTRAWKLTWDGADMVLRDIECEMRLRME